jgi:hypothetical protein
MKVWRFVSMFLLGWVVIATLIALLTDGWPGSGIIGTTIGIVLGVMNVRRGDEPWGEYLRTRGWWF